MNKLILILGAALIVSACGPSQEERKKVAAVTCSIMSETRNMDAAVRVEKMNDARDKIGGEPFLRGDAAIQEAFKWRLCQELVLNETYYDERLQSLKDAERERKEAIQERERLAWEAGAEDRKIAAEKQRIADSKPTVQKKFYSNGKLRSMENYQPKADGGKKHGPFEWYHKNGQLSSKGNFKDGGYDGLIKSYFENGQLKVKVTYKNGSRQGPYESYFEDGLLETRGNYKDGRFDGLWEHYLGVILDGKPMLDSSLCYKNREKVDWSYCEK